MSSEDSSGFSQIGRNGTISLLKRHEPASVITSFGIDSDELTFGRDPGCSVRLYYPEVSAIHCKIVFEERKAFLIVLGANGLLVDECKVFPSQSTTSPTTIPLTNNSEFEIHTKRFRFTYPPKELRASLFATPKRTHRALRLSMIQSAEVFSPRPSKDPRENLRVLQSPLKNAFKHNEEEDIVLVNGNYPRVVEEERDLVILEDVDLPPPPPPRTPSPQKKPQIRNTLHRAVLIRSAQRAIMQAEREMEDEEEEMEVVAGIAEEAEDSDESDDGDEVEQTPLWKKGLERIWPFSSSPAPAEDEDLPNSDPEEDDDLEHEEANSDHDNEELDEENEHPTSLPVHTPKPIRRALGTFMTPQPHPQRGQSHERFSLGGRQPNEDTTNDNELLEDDGDDEDEESEHPSSLALHTPKPARRVLGTFMTPQVGQGHAFGAERGRHSLGGGEARRVMVQQPWKVKDLVVPLAEPDTSQSSDTAPSSPATVRGTSVQRRGVDEEERKAIQERRRSALKQPDTFFAGGVPGMGASPAKALASPAMKPAMRFGAASREKDEAEEEEEEMDTRSLLERMKETVEGMKRRRSIVPGGRMSLGLGLGGGMEDEHGSDTAHGTEIGDAEDGRMSLGLGQIEIPQTEREIEGGEVSIDEVFSLLRPEAVEDVEMAEPEGEGDAAAHEDEVKVEAQAEEIQSDIDNQVSTTISDSEHEKYDMDQHDDADEEKPGNTTPPPAPVPAPKSPIHHTRKATAELEPLEEKNKELAPITPAPTRRGRKATVEPPEIEDKVAAIPTRRGRKATVEPETEPTDDNKKSTTVPASSTRRTRKTTAEPQEKEPTATPASTVRRGGRKAAVAATPVVESTPEETEVPRVTPATAPRKGRATPKAAVVSAVSTMAEGSGRKPRVMRGTRAKPADVEAVQEIDEDERDPLDTIDDEEEDVVVEAEAVGVKTRGRGVRKGVVKQEEADEALAPVAKSGRSKAAAAAAKPPAVAKSKAVRKTPIATATAAVDKENTPGDAAEEGQVEATEAVKMRVSRTRKAVGTTSGSGASSGTTTRGRKVKDEPVDEVDGAGAIPEAPATKARAVRSTRARTKT